MRHALLTSLGESNLRSLFRELVRGARKHRFEVAPNPCVGAAVLVGERVVARGYHRAWGGPHAEVDALRVAAESGVPASEWDTMVVTLEPCSSDGKTPPCTEAILRSGIRRVIIGAQDPDRRHEGRGVDALRAAGIQVELAYWGAPLRDASPHFVGWIGDERSRRRRPWTIAKWAQTRSGHLIPPADSGDGRWISSPESLSEVAVLRSRVDAIVTGVGTVLADDPRLTVRRPGNLDRPPLRVILDSRLRTKADARLLGSPTDPDSEVGGQVCVIGTVGAPASKYRALIAAGAEVHLLRPDWHGRLSPDVAFAWLWERGLRRVLLEAGPRLLDTCLREGLVDQVRVYTGEVFGGRGRELEHRPDGGQLLERMHRESGPDAVLEGFVRRTP